MPLKTLYAALGAALLVAGTVSTPATAVEVKATATVPYEAGLFSKNPTDEEKARAVAEAKLGAIKEWSASLSPAQQRLYAKIEPQVLAQIDRYISSWVIVAEDQDRGLKTLTLVVRANVNDKLLRSEMTALAGDAAAPAPAAEGLMASLFVARLTNSSTAFEAKVSKASESQSQRSVSASGSALSVDESAEERRLTTTGGSVSRKSAKETYTYLSSADFDAAFNAEMTQLGYESSTYGDVYETCSGGPAVEAVEREFIAKNDISSKSRNGMFNAARACDVTYFTVGNMDVSVPYTDSVTGNLKVYVSVSGRVYDITKKLPRTLASVGPILATGFGEDEASARRAALAEAAKLAGQAVADTLRSKNVR